MLVFTGVVGATVAIIVALSIPKQVLKGYIGAMVLAMGILVLVFRRHRIRFSWPQIPAVGVVSAFNKGISGGGYGPLVVSGQILSGSDTRSAIGVTSLADGFICLAALSLHLPLNDGSGWLTSNWRFYGPMLVGALLAAPAAAHATRAVSAKVDLRLVVGLLTCLLGTWTLVKTFG